MFPQGGHLIEVAAPVAGDTAYVLQQRVLTDKGIQQALMGGAVEQGLVLVLAVDIYQHFPHRLEHLHGDRVAIDPGLGAAIVGDHAAQQAQFRFVLAEQFVVGQPVPRQCLVAGVEMGTDVGT